MKTAFFFLLVAVALLVLLGWLGGITMTAGSVDLNLYQTRIIMELRSALILAALFLLTLFSLGGLLGNGFRSRGFWLLFFVVVICWGGLVAYVFFF